MNKTSRSLRAFVCQALLFVAVCVVLTIAFGIVLQLTLFPSGFAAYVAGEMLALAIATVLWFWRSNAGWIVSAVLFVLVWVMLSGPWCGVFETRFFPHDIGLADRLGMLVGLVITSLVWIVRYQVRKARQPVPSLSLP